MSEANIAEECPFAAEAGCFARGLKGAQRRSVLLRRKRAASLGAHERPQLNVLLRRYSRRYDPNELAPAKGEADTGGKPLAEFGANVGGEML